MDLLLKKLSETYGPSANEKKVSDIIKSEIKDYVDDIKEDKLGNLIAVKKGSGKKVMISAPMDEVSFLISYVDKCGRIKFAPMGNADAKGILNSTVVFENGICGVINVEDPEKELKLENLYIDTGMTSDSEVFEKLRIGDVAVLTSTYFENGKCVSGTAVGTRCACRTLIDVIKSLGKDTSSEIYFVFTAHGAVGARGARAAANAIVPEIALSIDSIKESGSVKMGCGPLVVYRALNMVSDYELTEMLNSAADGLKIHVQKEAFKDELCDVSGVVDAGVGSRVVSLAIPTRRFHTSSEIVCRDDAKGAEGILKKFIEVIK